MATLDVNLERARHMGIAEAKATLSGLVSDVEHSGNAYVIERWEAACRSCAPARQKAGDAPCAGLLSTYADTDKQKIENEAFARATEAKYGNHAA